MGRRRCVLGRRRRRRRQRPHEHKSSSPARERSKRGALCGERAQLHIAKRERSVRAHVGSGAAEERNAKSKPLQLWPTSQSLSAPLCLSRSHFSLFRSLGCSSAVSAPSAFPSDASVGGLTLQRRVACWSLHSPLFASDRPTLFGLHWPFHSDLVSSWRWLEHRSPRCLHRGGRGHSALLAYALGFWCFFGHGDSPDGGGLSGENLVFSACSSCAWSRSLARFCRQGRSGRRDTAAAAGRSRPWLLRPLGIRFDVTLSLSRIDSPAVCRCGAEVRLAAAMRGSCSTPAAPGCLPPH